MENEKFQELVLEQLKALAQGQARLEARVGGLEEGQQGLKQDVKGLQGDVKGLQGDVKELQEDVKGLQEDVKGLQGDVKELQEDVKGLQEDVLRVETRIENEVIEKIRALFDDRSMNQDYFASIRDAVGRVENRVEFLARQNIEHLEKMREHDRELRLLRAEKK